VAVESCWLLLAAGYAVRCLPLPAGQLPAACCLLLRLLADG
jgi:hypothetical protein